jgi:hypothetical protein
VTSPSSRLDGGLMGAMAARLGFRFARVVRRR